MNLSGLDFKKVTDFARKGLDKARQYAEGLNELEIKVEEATNSDRWGPHGTLMQEITKRSYNMDEYKQILGILARRLHSEPNSWRQVYKSLLLLEYMAKNGPQRIIPELKSNGRVFTRLQKFEYIDDDGKDQGLNVRNRAKELWNLVHDDALIASERDKAAANRKKYGGFDQHSSMFQSMPSTSGAPSTTASFTTEPRSNGGAQETASGSATTDAVAATEQRLAQLGITEVEGIVPSGGRVQPPKQVKHKPKLSEISADNSIAGSIAAIAAKAPAPPPKATSAGEGGGMNLLDFGDDENPTPAAPASTNPMALLDQLSNPTPTPQPAAGIADEDWADFTSTDPVAVGATTSAGVGATSPDDWAPFSSAAQPATSDNADDWADFASAPGGSQPGNNSVDPFGTPAAQPSAPSTVAVGAVPSTGARAALPLDAFAAPAVEPLPVPTAPVVEAAPASSSPVKTMPPEKDPFADLLG